MKHRFSTPFVLCILALFAASCSKIGFQPVQPTPDLEKTMYWLVDDAAMRLATQIMQEVDLKFEALQGENFQPTARATALPFPTATPAVTTVPESLRNKSNVPTPEKPIVCINELKFVEDITIKDKTIVVPGKPFTKTWKIQNAGTCEWDDGYSIVFSDGNQMDAMENIPFPKESIVKPDDTIEISVYMTAPEKPGSYAGYWLLQSSSGQRFGSGMNRDKPIWVKVEVR